MERELRLLPFGEGSRMTPDLLLFRECYWTCNEGGEMGGEQKGV